MKGEKVLEERSIRIVDSNKTFFGKLSSTLSKIIIPTKIGINGIVINLKRNNLLKAFENNINFKEKTDEEKVTIEKPTKTVKTKPAKVKPTKTKPVEENVTEEKATKKRGRPKGSKNKIN